MDTDALFAVALVEVRDDDGEFSPVGNLVALHEHPTREVFERAAALTASADPVERELGVGVLRELGNGPRALLGAACAFAFGYVVSMLITRPAGANTDNAAGAGLVILTGPFTLIVLALLGIGAGIQRLRATAGGAARSAGWRR